MGEIKTLRDFEDAPRYWKEYVYLLIAAGLVFVSYVALKAFEHNWLTVVASIVAFVLFVVQLHVAVGSTRFNQYNMYEAYLTSLDAQILSSLLAHPSLDEESQVFVRAFMTDNMQN